MKEEAKKTTKAEKCIRRTTAEHDLIKNGDHVVIGLSGGSDSVCLFHVLMTLSQEMELTVHPVHLNHRFRPGDAERDQRYVEDLCRSAGAAARVYTVDCNVLASRLGMTSEEAGRKARYDAFFETAVDVAEMFKGDDGKPAYDRVKIAVAQNANDQAETVLFRIIRGTGIDGLAGIAYEREERQAGISFKVIRPLLDTRREDIEEYCREQGLEPVTDHTNNEEIYSRNKIRLDLLPYIERKYNSNIMESLCRLSRIAASDKEFLWEETGRRFDELRLMKDEAGRPFGADRVVLKRQELAACHRSVRHRLIFRAFAEIGLVKDITAERLQAADAIIEKKQSEKVVEFPHGYRLTVAKGRVVFERRNR